MAPNPSILTVDIPTARNVAPPLRYSIFWSVVLLICDLTLFVLAAYIARSSVDQHWGIRAAAVGLFHSSIVFIVVWLIIFYILGLYQWSLALSFKDEFYFAVIALILGVAPQLVFFTILPAWSTSRMVLVLSAGIAIVLVGTSRAAIHLIRSAEQRRSPRRILIVGNQDHARKVCDNLVRAGNNNLVMLTLDTGTSGGARDETADTQSWLDAAISRGCDRVIITNLQDHERIRQFLVLSEDSGIKIRLALPGMHIGTYDLEIEREGSQHFLVPVRPKIARPIARRVKRIFDAIFASLAVLVSMPVMLIAGLAVWLESGSPIFFRQERVGRFGQIFNIIKFRTMKIGADSSWAKPGDSRITRVGAVLRRTSVDELPQLFNVLLGDMSLVGPRPEMRVFEEVFASRIHLYVERRLALPGITGWAQVNMKRNLTPEDVEQVLRYDLFYLEHWSVFLDLTVLLKTAAEFLFHRAM